MIYDFLRFLRAGLFAGAVVFANYDMLAAVKEFGVSLTDGGAVSGGPRTAHSAFIWLYLAEIISFVMFFTALGLHVFMQQSNDGRHAMWPAELFCLAAAFIFAYFTFGFAELGKLFLG